MANEVTYSISEFADIVKQKYPIFNDIDDSTAIARYLEEYPEDEKFLSIDIRGQLDRPGKELAAGFGKRAVFNAKSGVITMDDTAIGLFSQLQPPKQFYDIGIEKAVMEYDNSTRKEYKKS